jgi:hypothetical protein
MAIGQPISWNADSGISRLGVASLAVGNGTAGDYSGSLKLASINVTGVAGTSGNITLNTAASVSYDTNLTILGSTAQTGGFIFGSTASFGAANGPYFAGRGNTYSAIAGQRGILSLSAGNPSSPTGSEGSITFRTGNDALVMTMTAAQQVLLPSTTALQWNTDSGISRLGAASLAVGNGGAGNYSGSLKLTTLNLQGSLTGPYSVSLTAQAATIAATNLVATPVTTALYEITYYLNDTTAGTSGIVSLTITWNDGAAQSVTSSNVTFGTLGAYVSGVIVAKATSGAIQYATTVTSAVGSPAYSLDIRVKQLA